MIFDSDTLARIRHTDPRQRTKLYGSIRETPTPHLLHRSNMMLNPLRLEHLNRLDELEADVVTLNLEDAVAPARKEEALINIGLFLSHLASRSSRIVVRVNPLDAGGREEMEFLDSLGVDAVRIPKVREVSQLRQALKLLPAGRELHASIETREALRDLQRWGSLDARFTTVNLGILDLLADLDLPQSLLSPDNPTLLHLLARFIVAARTAGLHPVSFMYQEYRDLEGFEKWCRIEKEMGYVSKACLGPAQVLVANRIFAPDPDALRRAREIKEAFEASAALGEHGLMHERYGFVDEPVYRDALNLLRRFDRDDTPDNGS